MNLKIAPFFLTLSFFTLQTGAQTFGDVITLGDSLTAGLAGTRGGTITCAALGGIVIPITEQPRCRGDGREGVGGWQPRLKTLIGGSRVYNYGNTNERTDQIVARLPSHLAARPSQFVLILGGTNDMLRGIPVSAAISNLSRMIRLSRDAGRIPIIATIPPILGGIFDAVNPRIIELNNAIRTLPESHPDLVVAEIYDQVVGQWSILNSGDTIHFGDLGNRVVADIWFAAIEESVREEEPPVNIVPILQLLLDQTD